jgi:DnaJ family protein C protein 28
MVIKLNHMTDWLDKIIEEAMRKGQFDDLPGKGKPLNLEPNPHEDPEKRLAHKVLHDAGYKLPWIDERNEIEAEIKNMQAALARSYDEYRAAPTAPDARSAWDAATQKFRARAAEINKRIDIYNLNVPSQVFQRIRVDADSILQSLIPNP